jgi:hypothetical protein
MDLASIDCSGGLGVRSFSPAGVVVAEAAGVTTKSITIQATAEHQPLVGTVFR